MGKALKQMGCQNRKEKHIKLIKTIRKNRNLQIGRGIKAF
jgi:hypothetical protein